MPSPTARALVVLSIVALGATACGPGQSAATAPPAPAATTPAATSGAGGSGSVKVTVKEFSVTPAPASAAAGDVTFSVTNGSQSFQHEFVVIRTDLAPDKLPTKSTGEVDEEGAGVQVVDELDKLNAGETKDLKANLTAGSYVLICNLVVSGTSHYQAGMRTAFTVN